MKPYFSFFLVFAFLFASAQEIKDKEAFKKCRKEFNKKTCLADNDGDGILNYLDVCKDSFGVADNNGCPWPVPFEQNGKWGFSDEKGNIVIDCNYEKVEFFKNGLANVYDKCRTIHPHGEDVAFSFIDCKQGVINAQGKLLIPIEYTYISEFSKNGIAKAYLDGIGYNYYGQYNNGKVGYIDKTGKIIMPFIYKEARFLRLGYSILYLDNKVGLLNQDGKIVIPVLYDEIKATDKYYYYKDIPPWAVIQIRKGNKWGFYSPISDILVEPQFDAFYSAPGINIDETEQFIFTQNGNEIWLWNKANGKKVLFCTRDKIHLVKYNNLNDYFK